MMPMRGSAVALISLFVLSACGSPTPSPSGSAAPATASPDQAALVARKYLAAWMGGNFARMWELVAPEDQQRFSEERFVTLHQQLFSLVRETAFTALSGPAQVGELPSSYAAPAPVISPSASPSGAGPSGAGPSGASPSATAAAAPVASGAAQPLGPVAAMQVAASFDLTTDLFSEVRLQRTLYLTVEAGSYRVRWSPSLLFPELGDDGTLSVSRQASTRGRIVASDGTVFAMTRGDGMRVYPQESLAGQTIGYVSRVTSQDLATLAAKGYQAGDWVGRSGLERGAEDLLRGSPGFTLSATRPGGGAVPVLQTQMVPGASLTISIKPKLQRAAEQAMRAYPRVGLAAVDPRTGEVWVLASLPSFDPNAMTLGKTLRGVPLSRPGESQIINKAVLGAYPAGSDFKPFTLGAALQTKTVTTTDRMLCPGTWTYSGFTFQNWMRETLPGLRTWVDTMALSCNTTYMPLSVRVYQRDKTALTDLLHDFGFGEATGIEFLSENPGRLPDAVYFQSHPRWNGKYAPYGPFDQIQLAIGQGEYVGTPLQLAMAYAAWGNRGTLWQPRVVLQATSPNGTVVYESAPTVHHQIGLSKSVMDFVVTTMRAVITSPLGTAHRAFAGFPIAAAGKSGTAETGGPDPDAWFPGFAPMTNPSIAIATVVVTVPLGTGGDFAAPITRKVMEAHFFH